MASLQLQRTLIPLLRARFPSQLNSLDSSSSRDPVLHCTCLLSRCHLLIIFDCWFSTKSQLAWDPHYTVLGWTQQKTPFPNISFIVAYIFVATGTCLLSSCLAVNVYSGSTVPAFRHHVTVLYNAYVQDIFTLQIAVQYLWRNRKNKRAGVNINE
jgi:hypothetical protein